MPTASITAQFVNPPKGKGPGNIKTADGRYFKVWRESKHGGATLGDFEPGKTYDIEYNEEEPYNGKPQYMVTKIVSASTSQSTNGNGHHDASAAYRNADTGTKSSDIKWLACLKIAGLVYAGAGATVPLAQVIATARELYNEPISIVDEAKKVFSATESKEAF
jgi:hypothetical protein